MLFTPRNYPAKIILYGEYATLVGADALALPLAHFSASWQTSISDIATQQKIFFKLLDYLQNRYEKGDLLGKFDFAQVRNSLKSNNLYLQSDIPSGYGAGSSGSLVAAVYDRFVLEKTTDLLLLKQIFGEMESFFHGTSSGIDPLVSYVQTPLLIAANGTIKAVTLPKISGSFFLLDTQKARKTEQYVHIFKQKIAKNNGFTQYCTETLTPLTNACIAALLQNKTTELAQNTRLLSAQQLEHFAEMIPENMRALWHEGLQSNDFYLKLCGAGGGGFVLGYCINGVAPIGALFI